MSKNSNMPPKAPKSSAKKPETPAEVIAHTVPNGTTPLDRNRAMDGFGILERMVYHNPTAKEQFEISDETVAGIGKLIVTGTVALLVEAVESGDQFFADRIDAKKREELLLCAPAFGIRINAALLPPPNADGTAAIPAAAVEVSEETKATIAASKNATANIPELDPTKIENEEQLAKAVSYVFHKERKVSFVSQFQSAATLLKNWLKIQASDDKDASKKVDELTSADLYGRVTELVDAALSSEKKTCSLIVDGIGNYAYSQSSITGSPVQAFCIFRKSIKDDSGKTPISDEELATLMRVIIEWKIRHEHNKRDAMIEDHKKNLEELNKDKKANKKGIADIEGKIKIIEAEKEHLNDVLSFFTCPTSDVADNFMAEITKEPSEEEKKDKNKAMLTIRATRGMVISAYYGKPSEILKKYTEESINRNVQQRIGIILNLFRSSTQQLINYKEAFLTDFEEVKEGQEMTPTQKKLAEKKAEKAKEEAEKN